MKSKLKNLSFQYELSRAEMKNSRGGLSYPGSSGGTRCSNGFSHQFCLGSGYCPATGRGYNLGC